MREKVVLASESLFQPANGMRSTHLLVEIHNIHLTFSKNISKNVTLCYESWPFLNIFSFFFENLRIKFCALSVSIFSKKLFKVIELFSGLILRRYTTPSPSVILLWPMLYVFASQNDQSPTFYLLVFMFHGFIVQNM